MAERLGPNMAVFNNHVNDADKRAKALLAEFAPKLAEEIEAAENIGIMSIFAEEATNATAAYAWLVTAFVNENREAT